MTDATDALLAAQYECLPYPPARPARRSEAAGGRQPRASARDRPLDFRRTPSGSRPFNALIAGGGTGDATIMLAQQLTSAERPGTVTWLDRSGAALRVAQARAAARGLTNIVWEQRSLLGLPGSGLGPFDYVDCCGVLHHLPDPAEGLRALLSVLAPGGGLGLMVYAPHGPHRRVHGAGRAAPAGAAGAADAARLDTARRVLQHLPETAWFRFNQHIRDHVIGGDAGVYDLLLNPRDRPFSVPDFAALLAQAGLRAGVLGGAGALRPVAAAAGSAAARAGRDARPAVPVRRWPRRWPAT